MSQSGSIVLRVVAALVLIAVLAGGGYMVFQVGQAQGYALAAASVTATGGQTPDAAGAAAVPFYGYGPGAMGRYHHYYPFMGFFGIFPALIGLCFVFFLFRLVFWGPRHMHHAHWGYGPHYPWQGESPCGDYEHAKTHPESHGTEDAEKK